jgi:hypothetical protein
MPMRLPLIGKHSESLGRRCSIRCTLGSFASSDRSGLRQQLAEMCGEFGAKIADGLVAGWVRDRAVGREGVVGGAEGELVGEDGDADVAENGTEVDESAQAAETAGGCGTNHGGFAGKGGKGGFVVGIAAGDPVDGVFESGADAAVVFGRRDDQAMVGSEQDLEADGGLRFAGGIFEILVKKRQGEITQGNHRDFRTGGARSLGSKGGEFLIERIAAKAAAEGEDAGCGGHVG